MFVKNTGQKCIGLGAVTILPDETKELPVGYSEKHPTVKFYLAKGWPIPAETPTAATSKKAEVAKPKAAAPNKEKATVGTPPAGTPPASADGQAG